MHPMMPIFESFEVGGSGFDPGYGTCAAESVRPHPGQEMYSVLLVLTRPCLQDAKCHVASTLRMG